MLIKSTKTRQGRFPKDLKWLQALQNRFGLDPGSSQTASEMVLNTCKPNVNAGKISKNALGAILNHSKADPDTPESIRKRFWELKTRFRYDSERVVNSMSKLIKTTKMRRGRFRKILKRIQALQNRFGNDSGAFSFIFTSIYIVGVGAYTAFT